MRAGSPPAARRLPAVTRLPALAPTIAAALLSCLAAACSGGEAADVAGDEERSKQLVIFVYDRSWSMPDHTLEMARQLTDRRLRELGHGDRVAALELLQLSLAEPPKRWSQDVPKREYEAAAIRADSVSRARFLQNVSDYLREFSEPEGREGIQGTDLLSTMHDVAEELRPYRDRRTTLYLFSDMLQSTREIEMEGLRRMPPKDWVARMKGEGRLPDLSGLCVVVVGARLDTEAGQRVKEFWREYFEATGATFRDRNYMLRPVELPADPCPEEG